MIIDFADSPVARWPQQSPELDTFYRGWDGQTDPPPTSGPAVDDLAEVLRMIELDRAITFLPRSVAERFRRPGLVARTVAGLRPSRTVVVWRAHSRDRGHAALVRLAALAASARAAALPSAD